MKQERFDNLGQWKHNDHNLVTNPEYNKLAYSWPVKADGELNDKFDWPMEFFFMARAPSIKKKESSASGRMFILCCTLKS